MTAARHFLLESDSTAANEAENDDEAEGMQ